MTTPTPSTQANNVAPKAADQAPISNTPSALPDTPLVRPDFSGRRLKLGAKPIPGFHQCWINDTGTNLEENVEQGYQFVTRADQGRPSIPGRGQDLGDHIRASAGTQDNGQPLYAYLMKIPDLLFEEGMRSIETRNKQVQDSLRRTFKHAQGVGQQSKDEGAFYAKDSNKYQSQVTTKPDR